VTLIDLLVRARGGSGGPRKPHALLRRGVCAIPTRDGPLGASRLAVTGIPSHETANLLHRTKKVSDRSKSARARPPPPHAYECMQFSVYRLPACICMHDAAHACMHSAHLQCGVVCICRPASFHVEQDIPYAEQRKSEKSRPGRAASSMMDVDSMLRPWIVLLGACMVVYVLMLGRPAGWRRAGAHIMSWWSLLVVWLTGGHTIGDGAAKRRTAISVRPRRKD